MVVDKIKPGAPVELPDIPGKPWRGIPTPVDPEYSTEESESETGTSEQETEITSEEISSEDDSEEIETGTIEDSSGDITNSFDAADVEVIVLAINEQTREIQQGNIGICLGLGLLVGIVAVQGFRMRRV